MNILVVDDEKEITDLIQIYLENENFTVYKYYSSQDVLRDIDDLKIDLAILDVMMPDMDGFSLCNTIRRKYKFPIIFVTAKVEDIDKINGLSIGADDYVTKPFQPLELVARVKAQLRRYKNYNEKEEKNEIDFRGIRINNDTREFYFNEKKIELTKTEFAILWELCLHKGNVVKSDDLFLKVWGEDYYKRDNNTIMVHIRHLREKMHDGGRNPKYIKKVYGVGYKIETNTILKKIYKRTLLQYIAYTVGLLVIFVLAVYLAAFFDFQWVYDFDSNIYTFLAFFYNIVKNPLSLLLFLLICIVISFAFIIHHLYKQTSYYMDALTHASHELIDKSVDYITLPEELYDIERRFNELKSESIKNERLARENEQKKDELIVYLAHDIKTPLTSMIGYLSLLDEIKDMPDTQREKYINVALDKSYRLEDLINELFEVARYNSEKIILEKEDLDIRLMLEQIIDDFYPVLVEQEKNIHLNQDEDITLYGDADKLSRVFSNVIKNAISYSKDHTDINIDVHSMHDDVIIKVINKGKEIPKEKLNRIFENFYRLDSARTSRTGGSGLGLAIAKEIVELHHGSIFASSNKEETVFTITLPKN